MISFHLHNSSQIQFKQPETTTILNKYQQSVNNAIQLHIINPTQQIFKKRALCVSSAKVIHSYCYEVFTGPQTHSVLGTPTSITIKSKRLSMKWIVLRNNYVCKTHSPDFLKNFESIVRNVTTCEISLCCFHFIAYPHNFQSFVYLRHGKALRTNAHSKPPMLLIEI